MFNALKKLFGRRNARKVNTYEVTAVRLSDETRRELEAFFRGVSRMVKPEPAPAPAPVRKVRRSVDSAPMLFGSLNGQAAFAI